MSRPALKLEGSAQEMHAWADVAAFKARAWKWAQTLRVKPTRIQVRKMNRKWASCSSNGVVTFSTDLLDEPRSFGDVVMAHELLHLLVPNHGQLFRSLLHAHMPDAPMILSRRAPG